MINFIVVSGWVACIAMYIGQRDVESVTHLPGLHELPVGSHMEASAIVSLDETHIFHCDPSDGLCHYYSK